MMIEDEALRSQYKTTSEERLQKLEAGLLHLEQQADDKGVLATLRQEVYSLKCDSRRVSLEAVATLIQQIENLLESLQRQEISLSLEVSDRLHFGLNAISQLVHEAVTGEPAGVDMAELLEHLIEPVLGATEPALEIAPEMNPALQPQAPMIPAQEIPAQEIPAQEIPAQEIPDAELLKIYKATNQRRLQKLESGLLHLATFVDDEAVLRELLEDIHSLKSDSRQVGLETMVTLAQQFENVLNRVQRKGLVLSIELCAHLYEALKAMEQWVNVAVPDEVAAETVPQSFAESLMAAVEEPPEQPIVAKIDALLQSAPAISEDAELREIYKNISAGRLQKLEAGLAQLEKHPDDDAILAELLRQAHSFKGDSRSVGINAVEILMHNFEAILVGLQVRQMALTPALSNSLYLGLAAISQLVSEAVTSAANGEDAPQEFNPCGAAVPVSIAGEKQFEAPFLSAEAAPPQSSPPALKVDNPCPVNAIWVQPGELDALMLPVEELAVTRIQIAQATAQLEQIAVLLEKGRTNRSQAQSSTALSPNPHEEQLENLIATFRISAQANSAKLGLIAEDLREQIDALRLCPLSNIFELFPHLVQDLAKQQSKQVELKIEGGEITVDKRILEEIKDSLLHLVRNAIDHGVETPAERKSRSKPPTATIWLRGYQTDTGPVVELTDDGRGLDLEQIKQTAIRRQLHQPEELADMTPDQIKALILTPGFSTRTVITEISGRGVGLDVVRTHIERLQGNVQIDSTPGQGCTFRLQLSSNNSECDVYSSAMNDPCLAH